MNDDEKSMRLVLDHLDGIISGDVMPSKERNAFDAVYRNGTIEYKKSVLPRVQLSGALLVNVYIATTDQLYDLYKELEFKVSKCSTV